MKTVVTHMSPDLDATTSVWLVRKYLPGWDSASVAFVPAGTTLDNKDPDEDADIIHVDTGFGKFDHHQTNQYMSAARLVHDYLKESEYIFKKDEDAVERLVEFVTVIDNFGEVHFFDPTADVYDFSLHQLIIGIKSQLMNDGKVVEHMTFLLESVLQVLKNKIRAEEDIQDGVVFTSRWGKSIAMQTRNEEALRLALKSGYMLVLRKDPDRNFLNIKTFPKPENDLTPVYNKLKELDPEASWFLHASTYILLNGWVGRPDTHPTTLSLPQIVDIIKTL
ncbi:MAG: hypothetical protein RI947_205 [Candidatus Parcubacteria bacterium]|jgi:hypothetical protein